MSANLFPAHLEAHSLDSNSRTCSSFLLALCRYIILWFPGLLLHRRCLMSERIFTLVIMRFLKKLLVHFLFIIYSMLFLFKYISCRLILLVFLSLEYMLNVWEPRLSMTATLCYAIISFFINKNFKINLKIKNFYPFFFSVMCFHPCLHMW